ncbi:MAG: hypothetical protein ACLGH0_00535, partial [Thermoanaerobaculia bacterium]
LDVTPWLALLLFAILLSLGPSFLTHLPLTLFRYPARLVPIAAIAVAGLAVAGWERIRKDKRWLDLLIVLIIVADLLPRATGFLVTGPFRTNVVPYPPAIGNSAKVLRFGDVDPYKREQWISGYLNLYDRRFDAFTAAPLANEAYVKMYRQLLVTPRFDTYAKAGIAFILTRYELPQPWRHVTSAGEVHVYRNFDAFPMAAHFTPQSQTVRRGDWKLDSSSARITINAPRDGILVLRQQWAPGWHVTVDGRDAEPLVIDDLYRGVEVRAGRHEVVWKYRPRSFLIGASMTLITLLVLFSSRFVKRS